MKTLDDNILELCTLLQSDKKSERKKGYDSLKPLLFEPRVRKPDEVWPSLLNAMHKSIFKLAEDANSTKLTKMQSNIQYDTRGLCCGLISDIILHANRGCPNISGSDLLEVVFEAFESPTVMKFFAETYLTILHKNILQSQSAREDLKIKEWNDIFSWSLKFCTSPPAKTELAMCITGLCLAVQYGCQYSHLALRVAPELSQVAALYNHDKLQLQTYAQEGLLQLSIDVCKQIAVDCRYAICQFGETILDTVFTFFRQRDTKDNKKNLILDLFIILLRIHHPRGANQGSSLAGAHSWSTWNKHLQSMHYIMQTQIKEITKSHKNKELAPNFVQFSVELCKQVLWNNAQDNSGSGDSERPAKRMRLPRGLQSFLELIRGPGNTGWPWFCIMSELMFRFPCTIEEADVLPILSLVVDTQNSCGSHLELQSLCRCCESLLKAPSPKKDVAVLNELWGKLWDNTCRIVGLNQYQATSHMLLQLLVRANKCSARQISDLVQNYLTGDVRRRPESIETLSVLLQFGVIDFGADPAAKRTQLLNWLLPSKENKTAKIILGPDESKVEISLEAVAFVCTELTIKTSLDLPNFTDISKSIDENDTLSNIENIYAICDFKNKLLYEGNNYKILSQVNVRKNHIVIDIVVKALTELIKRDFNHIKCKIRVESADDGLMQLNSLLELVILTANIWNQFYVNNIFLECDNTFLSEIEQLMSQFTKEVDKYFESYDMLKSSVDFTKGDFATVSLTLQTLFGTSFHNEVAVKLRQFKPFMFDVLFQVYVKLTDRSLNYNEDDIFHSGLGQKDSYCIKVVTDPASLTLVDRVRLLILNAAAQYVTIGHGDPDIVLDKLIKMQFDIHKTDEFHMFCSVMKILCRSTLINESALDWIIKHMQRACRGHYKNPDVTGAILELLIGLFPLLKSINVVAHMQQNTIIMIGSFMKRCAASCYGPGITEKLLNCVLHLMKVDPTFSWSKTTDGAPLHTQVPAYLRSEFISIRLAAVRCLATHFDTTFGTLSLWQQDLFRVIYGHIQTVIIVPADLTPVECLDQTHNRVATALHMFASIAVVSPVFRSRALLAIHELRHTKNLEITLLKSLLELISTTLHTSILNLYTTHLKYLISEWGHDFEHFPWALTDSSSFGEFFKTHRDDLVPALIVRSESLQKYCVIVNQSPEHFVHSSFSSIISVWHCYQVAHVFSKADKLMRFVESVLDSDTLMELKRSHFPEIYLKVITRVRDRDHFLSLMTVVPLQFYFPETPEPFITMEEFDMVVRTVQETIGNIPIMKHICSTNPGSVQYFLMFISSSIQDSFSLEYKLLSLQHYNIVVELIAQELKTSTLSNMATFLIRDIIYTLTNIVKANYATENECLGVFAIQLLNRFCGIILPDNFNIFKQFLMFIISTLIPIAKEDALLFRVHICNFLDLVVVTHQERLSDAIRNLDPFPTDDVFMKYRNIYDEIKYCSKAFTLQEEIEHFLNAGNSKHIGCRAEGLQHLKMILSSRKAELQVMYRDLTKMRGFSEDCSHSVLHRLICMLVELVASKDSQVSMEAAKCLGELGPANLTTSVLRPEASENTGPGNNNIIIHLIRLLTDLLVDNDTLVVQKSAKALYAILASAEGIAIVNSKNIATLITVEYLMPFFKTKAKVKSFPLIPDRALFNKLVDNCNIWSPNIPTSHKSWIRKLVCNILKSFPKDCFLSELVAVCQAKVSFAEQILPPVIRLIVQCENRNYNNAIGRQLQQFFRSHFDALITLESDSQDSQHSGSDSADKINKVVSLNKASVQCMLNVVHLIRMDVVGNTPEPLELNYLHIAHAAQWCAAYFTSILYCELWVQRTMEQLPKRQTGLLRFQTNLLDALAHEEGGPAVQNILRECYLSIGDTDAVYGCGSLHLLNSKSRVKHYKHEGLWNRVTLHHDMQASLGHREALRGLTHSLNRSGLFFLSSMLKNNDDADQHECLWRLGNWTVNCESKVNKNPSELDFDRYHYAALKALSSGDNSLVFSEINQARLCVVEALKHASLESSKPLYHSAKRLRMLQELDEFASCFKTDGSLDGVLAKWREQDCINRNGFEYVEPVLAQRVVLLEQAVNAHGGAGSVQQALIDNLLEFSDLARKEGWAHVAVRNIGRLNELQLSPEALGLCLLVEAQLGWDSEDKEVAKFLLKQLMSDVMHKNSPNHCTALKLYGDWMVQTSSENPKVIIEEYFDKALDMLTGFEALGFHDKVKGCSKLQVYESLAQFADAQYQQVDKYMKSSVFEAKLQGIEKSRTLAKTIKDEHVNIKMHSDVRTAMQTHEKNSAIDETEIKNTGEERKLYLSIAMKYYLLGLQQGDNNLQVFRVVSLWLANLTDATLNDILVEALPLIPSYNFITVLPQLTPRLGDESDELFTEILDSLLQRCAIDHPHHTLPHLMALAHASKDQQFIPKNENTPLCMTAIQQSRVIAAQNIIATLGRKRIGPIVRQFEDVSVALIALANKVVDYNIKIHKISRDQPIRRLCDLNHVLVPTVTLPVNRSGKYTDIISVSKWMDKFTLVGGVNHPKNIICVGSDGVPRPQLLKGKDDLRQDAVMQQVFTIMNSLLQRNKETAERKLLIRTYKVVPLSQRSGVIEWCVNTDPLGMFLIGEDKGSGAHLKYRPQDTHNKLCLEKFANVRAKSNEVKLKVFLDICENFQPVFQHFFTENFPSPAVWFERRLAYTHSAATTSMVGYILGIGDRHVQNILIDKYSAELIHIDFGIAFEQGRVLPTPETVPFRLTRDIVAGMGAAGIEGVFRRCCEKTMNVMRQHQRIILTILEVLLYDPLYLWTVIPKKAYNQQRERDVNADLTTDTCAVNSAVDVNKMAERALTRLQQKLLGTEEGGGAGMSSVEGQVGRLIQQARDPSNLSRLFYGWQPFL